MLGIEPTGMPRNTLAAFFPFDDQEDMIHKEKALASFLLLKCLQYIMVPCGCIGDLFSKQPFSCVVQYLPGFDTGTKPVEHFFFVNNPLGINGTNG